MFCKNCGKRLDANDKFCDNCGTQRPPVDTAALPKEIILQDNGAASPSIKPKSAFKYYGACWSKYATFSGRAQPAEYWYFFLFNLILAFFLGMVEGLMGINADSEESLLAGILQLVIFLPSLAVGVRRMHDTGRSGWWIIVPFANLVYLVQDGQANTNRYGADPKGRKQQINERKENGLVIAVVAISFILLIGLLSTLAVVALNSARAKSRDSKRISDIKQIQTALELYYADNNGYPPSEAVYLGGYGDNESGALSSKGFGSDTVGSVYMGLVPKAPVPADGDCADDGNHGNQYVYSSGGGEDYSLEFCIGAQTGDLATGIHTATPMGIQ